MYEYIAQDSPAYAQRTVDRLITRSERLSTHPLLGSTVPEYTSEDVRELVERPYRIMYRVLPDRVHILAVIHGAQSLPPTL